jgi:quercetin dioxygenase-like cupin family protein
MTDSQMQPGFTIVLDPLKQQPIPDDGILTRQLHEDEGIRAVLFTFSKGQRLSEHTASSPALLHFLAGEATVTLGQESFEARSGTWVRMDPGLSHSIVTKSPVVMLLVLLKNPGKQ